MAPNTAEARGIGGMRPSASADAVVASARKMRVPLATLVALVVLAIELSLQSKSLSSSSSPPNLEATRALGFVLGTARTAALDITALLALGACSRPFLSAFPLERPDARRPSVRRDVPTTRHVSSTRPPPDDLPAPPRPPTTRRTGPAGPILRRLAFVLLAALHAAALAIVTPAPSLSPTFFIRVVAGPTFAAASAASAAAGPSLKLLLVVLAWTLIAGRLRSDLRARRTAANVATRSLRSEGVRRLMDLASSGPRPDWIADEAGHGEGDLESVEWWNRVMTTLWPHVSKAAESTVRKVVEPMLDHDKPRGVSSMTFDQFRLGDAAPRVDHVALVPPDEPDEIQVQVKMTWKGNPTVVFRAEGPSIYGGLSPVKIAMTDFSVSCVAKTTFARLLRERPVVGGVQMTLVEDPNVSYRMSVKAAPGMPRLSVSSIPGLSAAIDAAVTSATRERLVFPRAAGVVVAKRHTPATVRAIEDSLEITPVGQLRVTIVKARGLRNAEFLGKSDPYATVSLGSRKKVSTRRGTRHSCWTCARRRYSVFGCACWTTTAGTARTICWEPRWSRWRR